MNKYKVLAKLYLSTNMTITIIVLATCLVFNWNINMMFAALNACFVMSIPAVILVSSIHWILKRIEVEISFAWILLLSFIPLFIVVPAILFVDQLPGDVFYLVVLGVVSSYTGLLGQGISITKLFKSDKNG